MGKWMATITLTSLTLLGLISAKVYIVGDKAGWGPSNNYSSWVQRKTFFNGDILVFHYAEGYSVEEVTEEKYRTCDPTQAIYSATNGNTSIALSKSGVHFFIGGAFHECPHGMNLTLTVQCITRRIHH